MINKARMCLMLTLLVCMMGCQPPTPAAPVLQIPTPTASAVQDDLPVPTTPPPSPEGEYFESPLGRRSVSPNGQWRAYYAESRPVTRGEHKLVFLELSTGARMTYPVPPISGQMFWLSDSQHVLLPVLENNTTRVLWLFDVFQGTHTVVQEPFYHYKIEDVSSDGAYLYIAQDQRPFDLMRGSITGGPPINLTTDALMETQARYFPDGSKIIVIAADPAQERLPCSPCYFLGFCSNNTAYILDLSSGERHEISLPPYTVLSGFSLDGSRLLYQHFGACELSGENQPICIFDVETQQSHCIEPQGFAPTWSPDEDTLVFTYTDLENKRFVATYNLHTSEFKIVDDN